MSQIVPSRFVLRVAWASLIVVFAAYVAVVLGIADSGLQDVFAIPLAVVSGGLLALRGFAPGARRPAWLALSAGALLWAVGEVIYLIAYSSAPEMAPYPSVADATWLGAYIAMGVGIVLVLRARLRRAFDATMWLDAAIGAATVSALTAALAFDPVLSETGATNLQVATDLAYPLADLGLLSLVVTLLAL